MICEDCQIEESKHPLYKKAKDTELEEVKKGNRNYPGLFGNKTWAQIKEIEQ
jgi:hypothetical protein